jgi:peptidoglycan/LPS O-acetylase OafA/YrhL
LDSLAAHTGTVWAVAASLYVLVSTPLAGPLDLSQPTPGQAATKNLAYALIAVLMVLPAVAADDHAASGVMHAFSGRTAHVLGSISYGIFAYHVVVLGMVEEWLGLEPFGGSFLPRFLGTVLVSVGVAAVSFYGMERPLMRRGRRREKVPTFVLERAR